MFPAVSGQTYAVQVGLYLFTFAGGQASSRSSSVRCPTTRAGAVRDRGGYTFASTTRRHERDAGRKAI
jgi:hypothetical protein